MHLKFEVFTVLKILFLDIPDYNTVWCDKSIPAVQIDLLLPSSENKRNHFRIMLSHNLNLTYVSFITFHFTEILNIVIVSAMNYYVLGQELRVFLPC
jgi:hypothetical protein